MHSGEQWQLLQSKEGQPSRLRRMASATAAPQPLQPPPHLCFGASTLSFLYSHDLHLLEVRKVPVDKLFCLSVSPDNMQFIHDQVS